MIVIIPLGGVGQRFTDVGYDLPKPLIKAQGKEIIFWVLDSLKLKKYSNIKVFIVYNPILENFDFEKKILSNYPQINFYRLNKKTKGPAETIEVLLNSISKNNLDEKVLVLDGDTFYKKDIIKISLKLSQSNVFYSKNYEKIPRYSYIKLNKSNEIIDIREKVKISHNANTGAYFFRNLSELHYYLKRGLKENKKLFVSEIYKKMIAAKIICKSHEIRNSDIVEIGTPESLKKFSIENPQEKKRFCFDLDQTLVNLPIKSGDYETVSPIYHKIKFLKFLKSKGHYIIIHTARRMRTHKGNVKKVIKEIKKITINQLKKFDIPYDELIFGKPYAHYYIDDLAINAYENLQYKLGYYDNDSFVRKFNKVTIGENYTVKKSLNIKKILNEINYYRKLPANKKKFFPVLKDYGDNWYKISTIHSNNLSYLYINQLLTNEDLDKIFNIINEFHSYKINRNNKIDIYQNYLPKLNSRLSKIPKNLIRENLKTIKKIKYKLLQYKKNNKGIRSIIHGDLVFSNVFYDLKKELKLIDPRGGQQNKFTIVGDLFYDFAKIYQSLTGYEHILSGKRNYKEKYYQNLKIKFETFFKLKFGNDQFEYLKYLTVSLYISLIPLHDKTNWRKFFQKAKQLLV